MKDSAIEHVMSGVNPQGCHVTSFKQPSSEELDHDYLWRTTPTMRKCWWCACNPELLERQHLPKVCVDKRVFEHRYEDIGAFERYLDRNGIIVDRRTDRDDLRHAVGLGAAGAERHHRAERVAHQAHARYVQTRAQGRRRGADVVDLAAAAPAR